MSKLVAALIKFCVDSYSQNIFFSYKNPVANIATVRHTFYTQSLSVILNSPLRHTSQQQCTNISVYSFRNNLFTKSTMFFTCSGLFWFCLEMLPFLLICCFSLPKHNLRHFERHWMPLAGGCNSDILLRNLAGGSYTPLTVE